MKCNTKTKRQINGKNWQKTTASSNPKIEKREERQKNIEKNEAENRCRELRNAKKKRKVMESFLFLWWSLLRYEIKPWLLCNLFTALVYHPKIAKSIPIFLFWVNKNSIFSLLNTFCTNFNYCSKKNKFNAQKRQFWHKTSLLHCTLHKCHTNKSHTTKVHV